MPPALSQTNIEIVPAVLPWMSSWLGVVTIASATVGLVSETRVMAEPMFSSVERPTRSCTCGGAHGFTGRGVGRGGVSVARHGREGLLRVNDVACRKGDGHEHRAGARWALEPGGASRTLGVH